MDKVPMTAEGHDTLAAELKRLKTQERPDIIKAIAAAREHGDLSENAEYHAARERQSFVEGRVAELEDVLSRAEVIDVKTLKGKVIRFGATVKLADVDTDEEKTYRIVGEYESDIDKGLLSVNAPLSRALIAKTVGDMVEVSAPNGSKSYEVISVRFK